jgi:3'-5' exoribonuclease
VSDSPNIGLFPHSNGSSNGSQLSIRELEDGQSVDLILLVRERKLSQKRNGDQYLRLTLADASGTLPAVCWDDATELHEQAEAGKVVRVEGRYAVSEKYGAQLTVRTLERAAEGDYELSDLLDGPAIDAGQMEADFRRLIETVRNPHLKMLLDRLYGEGTETWEVFRVAPAAKFYHEAYRHGLMEHTLAVGQAVNAVSASFPGVDRDLAVTGGLIHDIGKIEAYSSDPAAIDLTDDGRLLGEIPLGYYTVRRQIEQIEGFPWSLARSLLHIVLAHHGKLENGSPVAPMTREAIVVHMVDNLGGTLGSFSRLEKGLQDGEAWSGFDRALSGFAYFASRDAAAEPGNSLPAASGE